MSSAGVRATRLWGEPLAETTKNIIRHVWYNMCGKWLLNIGASIAFHDSGITTLFPTAPNPIRPFKLVVSKKN